MENSSRSREDTVKRSDRADRAGMTDMSRTALLPSRAAAILPLTALLLLYLILSGILGHYKAYLYEDEVLSYTAANSTDGMRPHLEEGVITSPDFVRRAVSVQKPDAFNYRNAYENTASDPHPPLYLFLLHTICSLFPDVFSKWFGLGINIFFGLATLIFLYLAALALDGNRRRALAAAAVYALSLGLLEQTVFLRMYLMLQAATTLLISIYIRFITASVRLSARRLAVLAATVVFGTLVHYYFLIFAFFCAFGYSIYLLAGKRVREFLYHALCYLAAAAAVALLFPPVIWQITSSDVGSSSFSAKSLPELFRRARTMFSLLNLDLYGGYFKFYLLALIIYMLYILMARTRRAKLLNGAIGTGAAGGMSRTGSTGSTAGAAESLKALLQSPSPALSALLLTLFVSAAYFCTVSITTPYLTNRYLTPIYPLLCLLTLRAFLPLIDSLFRSQAAGTAIFCVLMAIPLYQKFSGGLFDVNKALMQQAAEAHSGDYCIVFGGFTKEENYFEFEKYRGLCQLKLKGGAVTRENLPPEIQNARELVVYIPWGKDAEEYFDYMEGLCPGLKTHERLYKAYYSDAYLLKGE